MTLRQLLRSHTGRDSRRRWVATPAMAAALVMCLWPMWSVPCCCVAAESAGLAGSQVAVDVAAESCPLPACCRNRAKRNHSNANAADPGHRTVDVAESDSAQSGNSQSGTATLQAVDIHECLCEHGECPSSERLTYLQSWFASPASAYSETVPSDDLGFSIAADDSIEWDLGDISKSVVRLVSRTTPLGDYPPTQRRAVLCCWRN